MLRASACAVTVLVAVLAGPANAFDAGNVLVYRAGDGTTVPNFTDAVAVFIDEYSRTGTLVGTIALPTAVNGSNKPLTAAAGSAEGFMTLSADGRYLVLTGYSVVPGSSSATTNSSPRVVGRIDRAGNVDTTTTLGTSLSTNAIRGAASADGQAFWISGVGGAFYQPFGSTANATQIFGSPSSMRALGIVGGQLYGTTGNSGSLALGKIGAGLPTSTASWTMLSGMTSGGSPGPFVFHDANPAVPGIDTVYVGELSTGAVKKWTFDGTSWTNVMTFTDAGTTGLTGLTGYYDQAQGFVLFASTTTELRRGVDSGGPNALFAAIATADANTAFRGIAMLPPAGKVAGDMNGDGRSDVLWRNLSSGQNYLYPMNGRTILSSEGNLRTVTDLNWKVAGVGDFNGDGKADILWRNSSTGQNYIYLMNGTAIQGEGYTRVVADANWKVAGVGDFNGDGRDDILWRHATSGQNYVYLMNGTGISGEGYVRTVADVNWKVAGVGDFDGDGKADILWRNTSSGQNYLYPMDGTTIKAGEGNVRPVADLAWDVKGIGDFDGDGKADILWRNGSNGQNYIYPMNGTAIKATEGYTRAVPLAWQVAAVGDYDGDGKADILWRNSSSGENYLYPMDGKSIKATEGYIRSVVDPNWDVMP